MPHASAPTRKRLFLGGVRPLAALWPPEGTANELREVSADPLTLKRTARTRFNLPAVAKAAGCALGLLLGHIDDPGLSIFLQASVAQFGSDAGLLVAPERNVGLQVEMPVDPYRARIDLRGHGEGPLEILRPDAAAEPELRIVRAPDGVFDLGIAQHRQNRAKLLLSDQSRIVGDVANNRRFDEIALALQNIAARNDNAVLFGFLQEALHPLEMRLVLEGPYLSFRLGAVVHDGLASQPPKFLAKFVVLRIVDVEALDHDAALAGIKGRAGEQIGRYF